MDYLTVALTIKKETDAAILVYGSYDLPNDNYGLNCWIPKSIINIENDRIEETYPSGNVRIADITIPTWFTRKNTIQLHNPNAHYSK